MKKKFIISGLALFLLCIVYATPTAEEGKQLFNARCASCHNVNKVLVGPALSGVGERHSEDWIIKFVHSSSAVIQSGDPKAIALYEQYNKVAMPDHNDLTPENIKGILAYIKSASIASTGPSIFRPEKSHPAYSPVLLYSTGFFLGYLGLVVILAASLIALVRVKEIQRNRNNEVS